MIHGLISLLYNGLLLGAAGAPLQRMAAWLAGWLDGCLARTHPAWAAAAATTAQDQKASPATRSRGGTEGRAHAHVKGNDLIQYRSGEKRMLQEHRLQRCRKYLSLEAERLIGSQLTGIVSMHALIRTILKNKRISLTSASVCLGRC